MSSRISRAQADRLGEALRRGDLTPELLQRLSDYRWQVVADSAGAAEEIRATSDVAISPREGKSTQSIIAKLRRQPTALSRMQDIVGCRMVVNAIYDQDAVASRLKHRFPDARTVDRRLHPRFGYRAFHLIIPWNNISYELQLRTRVQHAWAQAIERLSDGAFPDLKYGAGSDAVLHQIEAGSRAISEYERVEAELFELQQLADTRGALASFRPQVAAIRARFEAGRTEIMSTLDSLAELGE
jgi:putative GTP pyrophosphokinase